MVDKERLSHQPQQYQELLRLAKARALLSYFPELVPLLEQIIPGYPQKMDSVLVKPDYDPESIAPDLAAFDSFSLYEGERLISRIRYTNTITRSVSSRFGTFSLGIQYFLEDRAIELLYCGDPFPLRSAETPAADLILIKIDGQEVKADQLGSDLQQIIPDKISYTGPIKPRPPELDTNPEPIKLTDCPETELRGLVMAELLVRIPNLHPGLTPIIFNFLDQPYPMKITAWDEKSLGMAFYQGHELVANLCLAEHWREPKERGERFKYRGFTFELAWIEPEAARCFLVDYTGSNSYLTTSAELWIGIHPTETQIYSPTGLATNATPPFSLAQLVSQRRNHCTLINLTKLANPELPGFQIKPDSPLDQGLDYSVTNGMITIKGKQPTFLSPFSLTLPTQLRTIHPGIEDKI